MSFRIFRTIIGFILKCVFCIRVHGKENMPKEGALIVAMNHKSFWDGPLAATVLPRQFAIMAKKELFSIPVVGAVVRWAGGFPVSRGTGDLGAIKAALSALKKGKAMAIFPEGTRVRKGQEHKAKAGFVMIAEKTGVPIVPVAISGRYIPFSGMHVYIDKPVYIKGDDGEKLTGEQMQEISDYLLHKILHSAGVYDTPAKEMQSWISE